ncbi:MAG: hypothetical protein JOZ58_12585, partial [Acetobacteraceae bacterium]|nr:hypothetical protein [Acetobacteraceae bacterium]
NVFYQDAIGAGHSQVTQGYGESCSANEGDYIDNCNYDQAGILLQHIYGRLNPPNRGALTGHLKQMDQAEFTAPYRPEDFSLSNTGYVYVPQACEDQQRCRVHIALHGCLQSAEIIEDHYVAHAGYNEWADTNNIIVLYPQTHASEIAPFNPNACWDWWGYTNSFYATRNPESRQIGVIKAMLDRITGAVRPASASVVANDPTPTGLIAEGSSASAIALAWSAVPGASAYNVYRAAGADFEPAGIVASPSFGDSGLRPATIYNYKVAAVFGENEGPSSAVVSRATRAVPPRCDKPGSCPVLP